MLRNFSLLLVAAALALPAPPASAFSDATCVGDCNRDRSISVAELVTGSNIALGQTSIDACRRVDPSGDGTVTIDELVSAVRSCLRGCPYGATIRRTSFGIPHITASDFGNLGFGQGYALAEDHVCTVIDQAIKLRSRRAFFFGRGADDRHLNSDLAYLALDLQARAQETLAGLDAEIRDFIEGYAAGVNAFLADTAPDALPGWCAGASWVGPITATDVVARSLDLSLNASALNLIDYIATASPPGEGASAPPQDAREAVTRAAAQTLGSNGWAIGGERSENGRGMLVANPHFPWVGENRFWESHLTIPGAIDVYGASLIGLPGVQIGFNEHVAWTHTYSAGKRLTAYTLDLVPGDPTSYLYDGTPHWMSSRLVSVEVREADDSISTVRRRLWSSHYGPILNFPGLGWTKTFALTYRDANIDDGEAIAQFFGMDRASSLADFQRVHAEVQGLPFINTIAASPDGTVWYADTSATPNLSPAAIAAWREEVESNPLVGFAYDNLGTVLLDGSRSLFEWVDTPGARDPGLVPYSAMPQLTRGDYVFNSNDSYWVANGEQFLTGFSPLHGEERVPLSPRTRRNVLTLSDRSPDGPAGTDGLFSLAELEAAILNNRGLLADLLHQPVTERCQMAALADSLERIVPTGESDDGTSVAEGCAALAAWDGRVDRDSAGAALWREFVTSFTLADVRGASGGILFANPFDVDDPIGTPNGLAPAPASGPDPILEHLAGAMQTLRAAGVPLDAALGDLQHTDRNGTRIPIHGGVGLEGVQNIVDYAGLDAASNAIAPLNSTLEPLPQPGPLLTGSGQLRGEGYPVDFGTSFLLTMQFTDDGPCGSAVLTYGESGDPLSAHFSDQTELFSEKRLRPVLFTEAQIEGDPELRRYSVTSPMTKPSH